jgi:hypothetical protein
MRALSGPAIAALSGTMLTVVQLVYMEFPGFPIALNSSNVDIVWGGVNYKGAAGLGAVNPIDDSPGEVKGLQLTMSGVPAEYLALALDDANIVQGAPLTVRLAILDANCQVIDAPIDWTGRLDTMPIEEDGETCTIAVTYSNVDQWSLYPGDRAFEFVLSQANKPIVWAGKQWLLAIAR